jgi:hypothetical protein
VFKFSRPPQEYVVRLLAAITMDEHTSVVGSILRPHFTSDKFLALTRPQLP